MELDQERTVKVVHFFLSFVPYVAARGAGFITPFPLYRPTARTLKKNH